MEVLRSYVVRIYRQDADEIAGVVETVGTGEQRPFRSQEDLWCAVRQGASRRPRSPTDPAREGGE
jgi:hypothetical protein